VSSLHSENYSTSKPLNVSPEKSQTLSCDTVVANERYLLFISAMIYNSFIHSVFCLTTGPKPPPKRCITHSAI